MRRPGLPLTGMPADLPVILVGFPDHAVDEDARGVDAAGAVLAAAGWGDGDLLRLDALRPGRGLGAAAPPTRGRPRGAASLPERATAALHVPGPAAPPRPVPRAVTVLPLGLNALLQGLGGSVGELLHLQLITGQNLTAVPDRVTATFDRPAAAD